MEDVCRKCGGELREVICDPSITNHPHYGKRECASCGTFHGWISKPDTLRKKRPAAHRKLVDKFGRGYCELCLRKESELPPPEHLIGHHVDPYCEEGEATRENTWIVCSWCHSVIEQRRTYLGHYQRKTGDEEDCPPNESSEALRESA